MQINISLKWFIRGISIISDVITISLFLSYLTGWTMNEVLCNPFFKFVAFSVLFTGLAFAIPYLYRKITKVIWRYVSLAIVAIVAGLIIVYLPKRKCAVTLPLQKSDTTTGHNVIHDTIIKHDTTSVSIKPAKKAKPVINQKNEKGENNAIGGDNNGVQGGKNNKNHIVQGDNSGINGDVTITQTPEIKGEDLQKLLNWASNWKDQSSYHIKDFIITAYPAGNSAAGVNQIINSLTQNGFNMAGSGSVIGSGPTPEGYIADIDTVRKLINIRVGILR